MGKVNIWTGPLLTCILLLLLVAIPVGAKGETLIVPGVSVNGQSVAGLNYTQFLEFLHKEADRIAHQPIVFLVPDSGESITLTYQELGIYINGQRMWNETARVGNQGKWWKKLWERWQMRKNGFDVPLRLDFDKGRAGERISVTFKDWKREPQDAYFKISPDDRIEIISHEEGRDVNLDILLESLTWELLNVPGDALQLTVQFKGLKPEKTRADLEGYGITGLVSSYTTQFNLQRKNRSNNIRLAAKAIDNCLVHPGQVFSFNGRVGPRTTEEGYDEANIILNNELIPGVGGGVCQVSTTLYNAVVLAELDIVERYPHSLIIPYVEPGRDAAVVYGVKDFRFKNNSRDYLLIKSSVKQHQLTFKIYGRKIQGRRVVIKSYREKEIQPKTIYQEDPQVPRGSYKLYKEGSPGYIVNVERYVYDSSGKIVDKIPISRDFYPPVDRIIKTTTQSPLLSNLNNL